ncbi:GspE/PulE family protein [Polaromonas sp. YR568]|uniref:GspE/PulE family protein n=1 Tax=Polaromonas sp. YR568 TaxID=1855301 RepID=UPI00398BF9BF
MSMAPAAHLQDQPMVMRKAERELAEALLQQRRLSSSQLAIALAEKRLRGGSLHAQLAELGFVSELELRALRAQLHKLPEVDLVTRRPDPTVLQLLAAPLARKHGVLPVEMTAQGELLLAVDETDDLVALDQIGAHLRSKGVPRMRLALAAPGELVREIDRVYGERPNVDALLAASGKEPPVDKLIEAIVHNAYDSLASDIHFEPDEHLLRVRNRIDGVLVQAHLLHASMWPALAVKLKVMAGMNIAESRAAQDGRFGMVVGASQLDFRAACLPTAHGENIVLRLLDRRRSIVPLERLQLTQTTMDRLHSLMNRPEGIVLVTGPTGSGKTTTLYSMLAEISTEAVNVMTLEDPIEYPLPLIRQTQVTEKIGFAEGVRALMRQDPDVILVGEIRDSETAEMAFRAAMTGHQVFATLHTNSALGAVQRLRDIGVSAEILAGNMIGVIGQRLARRLCPHCKTHRSPTAQEKILLELTEDDHPLYQSVGCAHCSQRGFLGRVLLMEVLCFDETLDHLVAKHASHIELARHARAEGFTSLRDDAIRYVLAGHTTVEEVSRVVNLAAH